MSLTYSKIIDMKKIYFLVIMVVTILVSNRLAAQDSFIGEIKMVGLNFAPVGWLKCDGQLLPISQYVALFSIIGTTYGGDGITTFALPDLRGRVPLHAGGFQPGPGLSVRQLGEMGGSESRTMAVNTMPAHSHQFLVGTNVGTTSDPSGNFLANTGPADLEYVAGQPTATMNQQAVNNQGFGFPFTVMQPYSVVNFIIATEGIFPVPN